MSSTAALVASLNNVDAQINRYFPTFIFIFGLIGNILNILVLSQRSLRSIPCAIFFLASSFAGLISILSGLTPRVLSAWVVDPSSTVRWVCKLRGFAQFASRAAAFWFVMLATVDRWLLSCTDVHRRNLSSVKTAQRSVIVISVLSILIHSETFYCYEPNLIGTPSKCFSSGTICRITNDMLLAIVAILLPVLFMASFSLMTVCNIRQSRGRIQPVRLPSISGTRQRFVKKKTDHHLRFMLLTQAVLLALLTIPLAIEKIYATITANNYKSPLYLVIEDIIYSIVLQFTFLSNGMPFYIYTLSGGRVFRKALFNLFHSIGRKLMCR